MRCKVWVHFAFGHPPLGDVWQLPTPWFRPRCNRVTDCQLHFSHCCDAAWSSGQSQTSHVMSHYLLRWIWTADAPWRNCTHWKIEKLGRTLLRKSTKNLVLDWWKKTSKDIWWCWKCFDNSTISPNEHLYAGNFSICIFTECLDLNYSAILNLEKKKKSSLFSPPLTNLLQSAEMPLVEMDI